MLSEMYFSGIAIKNMRDKFRFGELKVSQGGFK